jgi:hypothetical protein
MKVHALGLRVTAGTPRFFETYLVMPYTVHTSQIFVDCSEQGPFGNLQNRTNRGKHN